MKNDERLISILKEQVQVFLLEAGEFYPFGTCINMNNTVQPISAYIENENDRPASLPLINILEPYIKNGVMNGDYLIGAIAIDVVLKKSEVSYDGVEMRFFEKGNEYKKYFKYQIKDNSVEFVGFEIL